MYGGSNFNQVSAINISPTIPQTPAVNVQNKSHSDSSGISQAEIDSMIKSQLALVPTTSLQPTQSQKTQVLQSRQKQSDHIDYPRVPDKYMPERPPDGYGVYSEKFIHANLINPTPTSNQVIESVAKDVYEKVMDKISSFLPKKKNNTPNNDDMDEITKGMSELSINKAIAKGISQGIKAVHDDNVSSQHRCSNCYSLGHNSRKCPYPRKRNRKNRKSRSKKRGSVNKVAVDSGSDTNSSDYDSSDNNSDSGDSSSEVESDHSFDTKQKNTPASGKSRNKSTVIDKSLQRVILDMLDGIAPIDWIEKLKAKIENPSDILPSIKKSNFTDCREPNDKSSVSDQISQEAECDENKNVPFEKWCAPAGFSLLQSNGALPLDSDNSTLKKNAMNLKNELL
ncbi:6210_t:CDS:2 [Entrophospora sp. SA101]|nr:6210_t:CDS:2 [Entrophospora sp. SA101]